MNALMSQHVSARPARPFREGLFDLNPPRLRGSRCTACGVRQFPARSFCAACRAQDGQAAVALDPRGVVFSYTVVHQSPARACPYVLAYVDLCDHVRVFARLDMPVDAVEIDLPVTLAIEVIATSEDRDVLGYVFRPDRTAEGAH
jgi:uncharacterized protein